MKYLNTGSTDGLHTRTKTTERTHLLQHDGLIHGRVPRARFEAEAGRASSDANGGKLKEIPAQHELYASERFGVTLHAGVGRQADTRRGTKVRRKYG